jgi:hypothetical protein
MTGIGDIEPLDMKKRHRTQASANRDGYCDDLHRLSSFDGRSQTD